MAMVAAAAAVLPLLCLLSWSLLASGSCPDVALPTREGSGRGGDAYQLRCGNHSKSEIQFGGTGQWFIVNNSSRSGDQVQLEIEDPYLSGLLGMNSDCPFKFRFPYPDGPLFAPPWPLPNPPPDINLSRCSLPTYNLLLSSTIGAYLRSPCFSYDLRYASKDFDQLPLWLGGRSQQPCSDNGTHPKAHPVLVWMLSTNLKDTSDGAFKVLAVSFFRGNFSDMGCLKGTSIGSYCAASGGSKRNVIVGVSTAFGASILLAIVTVLLLCSRRAVKSMALLPTSTSLSPVNLDPEQFSMEYPTPVFSFEELSWATGGFDPCNELGEGGNGSVYRGTLPDGRTVAVKRLFENRCRRSNQFANEVAILGTLRHPNLVVLYGCTTRCSRELLLVYEFIPNGTIADHLHGHRAVEGFLTWPLRLRIAVETATALAYLHATQPPVIHRDVKTNNILLDGDFHVKVGDFGLSRLFPTAMTHVSTVPQGTPGYVDPEYHRSYQLTDKSDVYSFGVVLAELISSLPAVDIFRQEHEINLSEMALSKIQSSALGDLVDAKLGFDEDWETRRSIESVGEIVLRCLQRERDMRPTMETVLQDLQVTADRLHKAEEGLQSSSSTTTSSPVTVMGRWPSSISTPNASG